MRTRFLLGGALAAALLFLVPSASAARPFRIGLIVQLGAEPNPYDIGGVMYQGFIEAAHLPGVEGRVVAAAPSLDPTAAVSLLARQHYDVIVAPLFFTWMLPAFERRYPHVTFLVPDGPRSIHAARNEVTTIFRPEEAAYLAGYLAALVEDRRAGPHVVGAVGGVRAVPQVQALIAGFRAGALAADPKVTVLINYSHDFADPAKCAVVAQEQITRGAGVVFNVAGTCGYGTLTTAKRRGVWGVGVDTDQSNLGPSILTSVIKREALGIVKAITAIHRHRVPASRALIFDAANGGVGLGKISPRMPRSLVRRLDRIRADIAAGKIEIPSALK
jgi:basic membrane protein A